MKKARGFWGSFTALLVVAAFLVIPAIAGHSSPRTPQHTGQFAAFSARSHGHQSSGPMELIKYPYTITNVGDAWDKDTFTVPVTGLYYFSVEFVKDSASFGGTKDDVFVYLEINPPGSTPVSRPVFAWSGEGDDNRGTGAVSTVLQLPAGTPVRTKAYSDGATGSEPVRHLILTTFSGYRIK
jgi:hypothetical protein